MKNTIFQDTSIPPEKVEFSSEKRAQNTADIVIDYPIEYNTNKPYLKKAFKFMDDWLKDFPNCCDEHQRLFNEGCFYGFIREHFWHFILFKFDHTCYLIFKRIDEPTWDREIEAYVKKEMEEFSKFHGAADVGVEIYLFLLKQFVHDRCFQKHKEKQLLLLFSELNRLSTIDEIGEIALKSIIAKWTNLLSSENLIMQDLTAEISFEKIAIEKIYCYSNYSEYKTSKTITTQEFFRILKHKTASYIERQQLEDLVINKDGDELDKEQKLIETEISKFKKLEIVAIGSPDEKSYLGMIRKLLKSYLKVIKKVKTQKEKSVKNWKSLNKKDNLGKLTTFDNLKPNEVTAKVYCLCVYYLQAVGHLEPFKDGMLNGYDKISQKTGLLPSSIGNAYRKITDFKTERTNIPENKKKLVLKLLKNIPEAYEKAESELIIKKSK